MKLKITYNAGKSKFYAIANNAAEAYEYVKSIIINEAECISVKTHLMFFGIIPRLMTREI